MSSVTAPHDPLDNSGDNPAQRADLVLGGRTISDISDIVCEI